MNTKNNLSETAIRLCDTVVENGKDANNVLTSVGVSPVFQTHVVNVETGKHGIKHLIAEILTAAEAVFPEGAENGELRPIVLASAMLASEVKDEVERRFSAGSTRYPYSTVHQYLSVFMVKEKMIAKVQMTKDEDQPRPCYKPRTRYYLRAQ